MKYLILFLVAILFTACGPSIEARVQGTMAAIPTGTAIVRTQIVQVRITVPAHIVERVEYRDKIITTTPVGPTSTPEPMQKLPKQAGTYLVGSQIASGNWQASGTTNDCYYIIKNRSGDILEIDITGPKAVMNIPAIAFSVELDSKCGIWTFIE